MDDWCHQCRVRLALDIPHPGNSRSGVGASGGVGTLGPEIHQGEEESPAEHAYVSMSPITSQPLPPLPPDSGGDMPEEWRGSDALLLMLLSLYIHSKQREW